MPQGNYAIVTRADEGISEMTKITHPIIQKYADKIGAKFIILDKDEGLHHHYRILQFYKLFDAYDRIISMDSDVVILPDCPNLFDIVPEDKIGTVFEDVGSREMDRKMRIANANLKFGDNGWRQGYINTGVAVFSKCHRELFKQRELYMDLGFDDVYLGYYINKLKFPVFELDPKFNWMTLFSERWNGEKDRLDAYIIHYAGTGFGNRMEDLKRDAKLFYSDFPYPEHKNHLIIDAIGDAKSIMDVGCGEGILTRYLIKTFPDKEILAVDIEDKNRFGLKVEIGDLTDDFKYKAEVVIASEVLEHIRWWKDALQSLLEASTGKVIITIPYGHSFYNKDHVNFWDDESIKEFITLCDPHKVTVSKEITKPEDIKNNSLIYFITIQK